MDDDLRNFLSGSSGAKLTSQEILKHMAWAKREFGQRAFENLDLDVDWDFARNRLHNLTLQEAQDLIYEVYVAKKPRICKEDRLQYLDYLMQGSPHIQSYLSDPRLNRLHWSNEAGLIER